VACCGSYVVEGTSADTCSQSDASALAVGAGASTIPGRAAPARALAAYAAERGLAAVTDGRGVFTKANMARGAQLLLGSASTGSCRLSYDGVEQKFKIESSPTPRTGVPRAVGAACGQQAS
jgi:hypothetical protein